MAMVGLFITIAPAVTITMIISQLAADELKPYFGERDSLLWWALAILGHLLLIGVFIAVLFARAWGGPSRIAMAVLMPTLALLLDIIVTAGWWFMAALSHPHGFR